MGSLLQANSHLFLLFFIFVVSRCCSTFYAKAGGAIWPKALVYNHLHDSIPTPLALLSRLAIAIALA